MKSDFNQYFKNQLRQSPRQSRCWLGSEKPYLGGLGGMLSATRTPRPFDHRRSVKEVHGEVGKRSLSFSATQGWGRQWVLCDVDVVDSNVLHLLLLRLLLVVLMVAFMSHPSRAGGGGGSFPVRMVLSRWYRRLWSLVTSGTCWLKQKSIRGGVRARHVGV